MKNTSEVYKKLYHYTTWDGLLGILKSQTLWATHYKFLNDYSEIILFREKLIEFLIPHVYESYRQLIKDSPVALEKINKNGGLRYNVEHDTKVAVDAQYGAIGDEIYILSFCGHHINDYINNNGLLSQWRGYGTDGGFLIVFDTKKIEDLLLVESNSYEYSMGHISDIIYSDDEDKFQEELSPEIEIISNDVKKLFDHKSFCQKDKKLTGFGSIVKCISRYKHHGFKEENEVRVVALPTIIDDDLLKIAKTKNTELKAEKERKYRNCNGRHIPYIELFDSSGFSLPIERIIVGPHHEKELRASTLRVMLRNTDIKISISDIPFAG